jgi:hypothetical protein
MTKQKTHSGRRGDPVSLAPLTGDEALAAALRVKPADLRKLEAAEAKLKAGKKKKRGGAAVGAVLLAMIYVFGMGCQAEPFVAYEADELKQPTTREYPKRNAGDDFADGLCVVLQYASLPVVIPVFIIAVLTGIAPKC